MVVVGVDEPPSQTLGEQATDRRFPGACRSCQHNHHLTHPALQLSRIAVALNESFHPGSNDDAAAVYAELRRIAAAYMRRERPGQTLQPTALVHEAYLRLAGAGTRWTDRRHFIGVAARSMRQVLVDRARARGAQKRWAGLDRVSLTDALVRTQDQDDMLPALDDAMVRLEQIDPEGARIIELRYFVGLTVEEAAEALGLSPATLKRRFALARAWLFRELSGSTP